MKDLKVLFPELYVLAGDYTTNIRMNRYAFKFSDIGGKLMGEKLYYVFKIIKEAREPISAKDILRYLENYEIFLDIKTVYSLIKKLNDFYYCLSNKQLIKTIRRRGYIIDEDIFEDGQLQLLIDSVNLIQS